MQGTVNNSCNNFHGHLFFYSKVQTHELMMRKPLSLYQIALWLFDQFNLTFQNSRDEVLKPIFFLLEISQLTREHLFNFLNESLHLLRILLSPQYLKWFYINIILNLLSNCLLHAIVIIAYLMGFNLKLSFSIIFVYIYISSFPSTDASNDESFTYATKLSVISCQSFYVYWYLNFEIRSLSYGNLAWCSSNRAFTSCVVRLVIYIIFFG